ncbi:hypothetical protein [Oerskovia jenensis]|uniref:hypothetical protein n=1 Tax=Oerskovia jenensis TaxID=162169 RepID=UPI0036DD553E
MVQFDPATGEPRWDTACLRRNWIDRTVSLVVLKGGATPTISPLRTVGRGTGTDDQPLWLAQVRPNEAAIGELRDLRCWSGNGGLAASDTLALDYLKDLGSVVQIGDTQWVCIRDAQGAPAWSPRHQPTRGERPEIYAANRTHHWVQGARNERLGGAPAVGGMNKNAAADGHFTYVNQGFGPVGTQFITKTGGMYSMWVAMTISNSLEMNAELYFGSTIHAPVGGLPGSGLMADAQVVGGSMADVPNRDAYRKLAIQEYRYLKPGATISASFATNGNAIIESWQMWAQRVSD